MKKGYKNWGPPLLLISPTIIVLGIFVYGLIGANISVSLSNRNSLVPATEFVGLDNYIALFGEERFIHSLQNLGIFTLFFIGGTMIFGFLWAWMLDKGVTAEGVFRSVFLFPMAISFVASGVVWRWLLNSAEGDRASGLNRVFENLGLDFLQNSWWNDPTWGMAAIALPAIWQLAGYVMALFLSGFRGIPEELREAARMDGATEWKLYRYVIFPQLSPVALSALIIVGHMSLKVFDLIMAITKSIYQTEVPATYLWVALTSNDYAKSATIATILLLFVAVVIVPYLIYTARAEKRQG
ncbi:sugar ABC transporter permease [Salinibacterium sp. NSLL150]|uniref:carbohydrate ABC transporter permease n=1 Tax=unclassified Salinibacterium TaxID=2632331 RepID=UPI001009718C|nr:MULTISPECIES: sugar ABC transporter permease [unclassified Salinibacterium]MBH0009798.1 sugar ABC transporter permease [Salinibacterium sp. SWN1162]MBH0024916.1 sugar ABC transporter permease [Salinibacterium sp. SWN248]MBH0083932.1 sugar ABC transporter permease [Salinibacterium sp. SWN167]MBH0099821.1 sugar ABC transporter permease [Salinibacterium sp. NSLL35]MBH0102575.1 sugar ABC transporter permease [Salinibacterium sp. NSLL150]